MRLRTLAVCFVACLGISPLYAQSSAIPQLNSRSGAAYTLYLNFGGFNYSGSWFGDTPGATQSYDTNGNTAIFNVAEQTDIRNIWSRAADKYSAFNINVTTVDPSVAAGQSASDSQRQTYYDNTAKLMHMVIGGDGAWAGGGLVGISGVSVAATAQTGGGHTNWTFSNNYVTGGVPFHQGIAETIAHENGHALKLQHQSLYSGTTKTDEYDPGTPTRAPIMGNSDNAERGLWRKGTSSLGFNVIQNDPGVLLTNAGIAGSGAGGFVDSGVGHTRVTATTLALTGSTINSASAKGVITPNNADPNPLGEANYTTDFFKFTFGAGGGNVNVTLRSGLSTITAGIADDGATLDATLRLLNAAGTVLFTSNTGTFAETINQSNLAAGTYYLQISSAGADAQYFDMGSYFVTGTITPVPEPATVLLIAAAGLGIYSRVRRQRTAA